MSIIGCHERDVKHRDRISGFFLFFLGLAVVTKALLLGLKVGKVMGPGFFPFLGGIILTLLSGFLLFQSYMTRQTGEMSPSAGTGGGRKRVVLTLIALGAYPLVINRLGFVLSTFFLLLFLFRGIARLRWRAVLTGGVIAAIAVFLIFQIWLKANLPSGPLGF